MTFLNPLVLIGLVAAAIPLVIHLFNFRRPQRLDFSSLALLQALQRTTLQRVRIQQWFLLSLRTLAISALICAFARPVVVVDAGSRFLGQAHVSMAIVVDSSPSMTLRTGAMSQFDRALELVDAFLRTQDPGDEVFLFGSEGASARETLQASSVTVSAAAAIDRASDHLADHARHLSRTVYYLGDLQASTLVDSAHAPLDPPTRTVLVGLNSPDRANVGLRDVTVVSQIVEPGRPVTFEASVYNYADAPINDYAVGLYLDEERVAGTGVALPPDQPVTVTLTASPDRTGWLSGHVQIEDDPFSADNRHNFTLQVPSRRHVLLLKGAGAHTNNMELALSLGGEQSILLVNSVDASALSSTPLGGYDAVFLVGPETLSSGEVAAVEQYVAQGGGLMVFPGPSAAAINTILAAVGGGRIELRDGRLSGSAVDYEHPLFDGVFEDALTAQPRRLEEVTVFRSAAYSSGTGIESTLIELSDGAPFLREIRHGSGRVLFLAVAPEPAWSDLPVRGLFIPLLFRAAHYLASGESVQGEQLIAGQDATLRVPGLDTSLEVLTPTNESFIPIQRSAFGAVHVDLRLDTPGVAALYASGEEIRRLSINADPRESALTFMAPDSAAVRLAAALGAPVEVAQGPSLEQIPDAISLARRGLGLWRHFLILALGLLTAEMLVARFWRAR